MLNGTIPSGISDTGASSSCAPEKEEALIKTGQKSTKIFLVPTGEAVPATEKALLAHELRGVAREVEIVPGIKGNVLLSTGKMTDENYIAVYDKEEVNIFDGTTAKIQVSEEAILKGYRCKQTGQWRIPLKPVVKNENADTLLYENRPSPTEAIANVYELPSTEKTIRYLHAAAGFPTKSTWLKAIRAGNYNSWPGLSCKAVNKYFPESDETQKGHMKQSRQGVRSTKVKVKVEGEEAPTVKPHVKHSDIYVTVLDHKNTIYTDQPGPYPVLSRAGNRYQMVLCEIDSNAILVEAMRNRTEGEMIKTYQKLIDRLKACGIHPKLHILDNEASKEYKRVIRENGMDFQLVPPHTHRRNIAERGIQVWKDHFIAVMSGTDESFPRNM